MLSFIILKKLSILSLPLRYLLPVLYRYLLLFIFFPCCAACIMSIAFCTISFFSRVLAITTCELTISLEIESSFWISFNIEGSDTLALLGSLFIADPLFRSKHWIHWNTRQWIRIYLVSFFLNNGLCPFFDGNHKICSKCSIIDKGTFLS